MENLDEILEDGIKLIGAKEALRDCLIRASGAIDIGNEESERNCVDAAKSNWRILCGLSRKYPDSKIVKNALGEVRKDAKQILPYEVYEKIYESELPEKDEDGE